MNIRKWTHNTLNIFLLGLGIYSVFDKELLGAFVAISLLILSLAVQPRDA